MGEPPTLRRGQVDAEVRHDGDERGARAYDGINVAKGGARRADGEWSTGECLKVEPMPRGNGAQVPQQVAKLFDEVPGSIGVGLTVTKGLFQLGGERA